MEKFSELEYERPDYEAVKATFKEVTDALENATVPDLAVEHALTLNDMYSDFTSMEMLASIRYSIDTNNPFYEKETEYWDEYGPRFNELVNQFYAAALASPFQDALKEVFPETFFMIAKNELRSFSSEVIELVQQDNKLKTAYGKLIASAQIEFDGNINNLPQMTPYTQSIERQTRKAANEAITAFFVANEATFDNIYDQMVKIRTQIAHKLGFKTYTELSYVYMNRFDYTPDMVATYRKEILNKVVPVANKLYQRQAKRIGVDQMAYYDKPVEFQKGNAKPKGTSDELIAKANKMYHEMSTETGEFFDFMVDHQLLDLLSKPGKESGGYCEYIPKFQTPFIFANFNGTSGDVDVLTHEAGHAFQTYMSRWIKATDCVFPTTESCEIDSMSMEFFAYPWMESFFGDQVNKYKFKHLESALQFLPYGVLVDHFQNEVYDHPEMTPTERKATWHRLEKQYCPELDYTESPALDRGIYWYRQGHIFGSPFYYIDYTLAQVCAFQFWKRAIVDHDKKAWEDYLAICKVGGTQTFLEIIETGHLKSPFVPGALDDVIQAIDKELAKVSDASLEN